MTDSNHATVDPAPRNSPRNLPRNPPGNSPRHSPGNSSRDIPLDTGPGVSPAMLSMGQVAGLLNCSKRTVYRLNDTGQIPRPVRLGSLLRWNRTQIQQWIANGCPAIKGGRS